MTSELMRMMQAASGFTFVETIVVTAIMLTTMGAFVMLTQVGQQLYVRTDSTLITLADAQRGISRIAEDLRAARQTGLSCANGQLAFTRADGVPVTYRRDATRSQLVSTRSGRQQVILGGVQAFRPTCLGSMVQVSLTATLNTRLGQRTRTLDSQVLVRNP